MKKLCAIVLSLSLVVGIFSAYTDPVYAQEEESKSEWTFRHEFPSSIKIGEDLRDVKCYIENIDDEYSGWVSFLDYTSYKEHLYQGWAYAGVGELGGRIKDKTVVFDGQDLDLRHGAYIPGELTFQVCYSPLVVDPESPGGYYYDSANRVILGEPIVVNIEEPIIQTNAPAYVKVNDSIELITELTNTALENKDVSYYLDDNNYYHYENYYGRDVFRVLISNGEYRDEEAAYQPSVEILEGKDIVEQSEQDYSNTLKSTETLSFTSTGTVKLKVKYNQIITSEPGMAIWELVDEHGIMTEEYHTYSPEKIITIQVTEDGLAPKPDKSDLQNLVSENDNLSSDKYTAESYQVYKTALEKANEVLSNADATQEEIIEALESLEAAIDGLVATDDNGTTNEDGNKTPDEDGNNSPSDSENSIPDNDNNTASGDAGNNSSNNGSDSPQDTGDISQVGSNTPQTGDNIIVPAVIIMILSLCSFFAIMYMKKEKC